MKYGGPSGGSLLSGGGIIILRVIRRHFLAVAMDPAVSLSMYSTLLMEVGHCPHLPRRAESTKAVDDNKALEGDDAERGKTRQWMPTRRVV